jgi:hypothetical protein
VVSRRPRVYCGHPIVSYRTEHEAACLAGISELLPGVELFNPEGRYSTDASWRRAWPQVLASLSGLVVFASEGGTIGVGCLAELTDALAWDLPVAALDAGRLFEIEGVQFLDPRGRSARHVGRLVIGEPYGDGLFAALVEAVARGEL